MTLLSELSSAHDMNESIKKIVRTEKKTGKMYQLLEMHCRRLSEYYLEISRAAGQIAGEEFNNRDIVMGELKNY